MAEHPTLDSKQFNVFIVLSSFQDEARIQRKLKYFDGLS